MVISPKSLASWGLLSPTEGGSTQAISEIEVVMADPDILEVDLEVPEVELSDD